MSRRSQVSRGDLLLCLEQVGPEFRSHAAATCGFAPSTEVPWAPSTTSPEEPPPLPRNPELPGERTTQVPEATAPDLTFWFAQSAQSWEADSEPPLELAVPFSESEMRSRTISLPPKPPLMRWARLWPYLRSALGRRFETGRLDDVELVRRMAASLPITRLPRRRKVGWAPRAAIWLDRRVALAPFWEDMDRLVAKILKWRPEGGLEVVVLPDGRPPEGREVRAGSYHQPLLVLGDLGCFSGGSAEGDAWSALGLQLRRRGAPAAALMPCPRDRWRNVAAKLWRCSAWDRGQRLRAEGTRPAPQDVGDERAAWSLNGLLALISPAVRCELGLLRCLRLAVLGADVGTEFDVWNHDEVARMGLTMALEGPRALVRAADLVYLSGDLKEHAARWIARFHEGCGPTVRIREAINFERYKMLPGPAASPVALADQRRLASYFVEWVRRGSSQDLGESGLLGYLGRELDRTSPAGRLEELGLSEAFAAAVVGAGVSIAQLPEGMDAEVVRKLTSQLQARGRESGWEVKMVGQELRLESVPRSVAPRNVSGLHVGLPLAWLRSGNASFSVTAWSAEGLPKRFQVVARDRHSVSLPISQATRVSIRSDRAEIVLGKRVRPTGALRFGHDRFGQFAEFEVRGVALRLRWIPPGTFLMGSPESENGRFRDEGPQRWVTILRGYWLADTPCTQALWEAVMGGNPSHFRGAQRPVESVDWNQCRSFCERMSREVQGLVFRLPTEAEWEYACRAGTETAFNDGSECAEPEGKDAALDRLGWFKENSGGMTHPVRAKVPNAWGLYDMHGNVWEWSADGQQDDRTKAKDPQSSTPEGTWRVLRGGGYWYRAWRCRSASRYNSISGYRSGYFGFRLAAEEVILGGERANVEESADADGAKLQIVFLTPTIQKRMLDSELEQYIGGPFKVCWEVINPGNSEMRSTVVEMSIPSGIMFRAATEDGFQVSDKVVWSLGLLEPGVRRRICASFIGMYDGEYLFHASAVGERSEFVEAVSNVVRVMGTIYTEVVGDPTSLRIGEEITYLIRVTNRGGAGAVEQIGVKAIFPQEINPTTASNGGGISDDTVTWAPIPMLLPRQTITYTVRGRGLKTGDALLRIDLTTSVQAIPITVFRTTRVS